MRLLPRDLCVQTGELDKADWNYRPLLGFAQRKRFSLALSLIGTGRYRRLLEVGYGSGVFMPELALHCDQLFGVDIHHHVAEVEESLRKVGVEAHLEQASADRLPYEGGIFDCVVSISTLEFIEELEPASREIARVLRPTGKLVVVVPAESLASRIALYATTRQTIDSHYGNRLRRLLPALEEDLRVQDLLTYPNSPGLRIYRAARLQPRGQ